MEWVLCLGHAVLGLSLLPASRAGEAARRRAVEIVAAAGAGLGVALVGAGAAGGRAWRSVAFEPESAVPAGFAVACAWILVGAVAARRARVEEAALAGVACSGLALAATGRFVVPALLFWLCSSLALAALAGLAGSRSVWPVLALSDAAACVSAIVHVARTGEWAIDGSPGGAAFWLLAAAAVVRGGIYLAGPGSSAGTDAAAVAPLMAGGAVVLAVRAGRAEPWLALAILLIAGAALGLGLARERLSARLLASWPVGLALAICFVTPGHAPLAGAVATMAVAAGALMPSTGGRAGFERGLLVAAVPLTAGFGVVAAGATVSFERATDAATSLASAPWTAVAALLPAALAAGVVLAARAARADAGELVPEAVLATWALLAGSVVVGIAPGLLGGSETGLGDSGGVAVLHVAALAAGIGAALATSRWGVALAPAAPGLPAPPRADAGLPARLGWASVAVGVATAGAAGWLTVRGLSVGFL